MSDRLATHKRCFLFSQYLSCAICARSLMYQIRPADDFKRLGKPDDRHPTDNITSTHHG